MKTFFLIDCVSFELQPLFKIKPHAVKQPVVRDNNSPSLHRSSPTKTPPVVSIPPPNLTTEDSEKRPNLARRQSVQFINALNTAQGFDTAVKSDMVMPTILEQTSDIGSEFVKVAVPPRRVAEKSALTALVGNLSKKADEWDLVMAESAALPAADDAEVYIGRAHATQDSGNALEVYLVTQQIKGVIRVNVPRTATVEQAIDSIIQQVFFCVFFFICS
jgi:hypothetical protein